MNVLLQLIFGDNGFGDEVRVNNRNLKYSVQSGNPKISLFLCRCKQENRPVKGAQFETILPWWLFVIYHVDLLDRLDANDFSPSEEYNTVLLFKKKI